MRCRAPDRPWRDRRDHRRQTMSRCHRKMVPGVTISRIAARRSIGSVPASRARNARSGHVSRARAPGRSRPATASWWRSMRISASFHHASRRDKPSSDTARETIRKISFKPTNRRSSHLRSGQDGRRMPNARPRSAGPMPRRHRFSVSSGVAGASEPRLPDRGWAGGVRQSKQGSASLAMIQPNCSSSGISSLAGIILSSRDTMAPRVRPRCSAITARSATARTAATSSSSSSSVHRAPGEASGASPAPSAAGPLVMHG